MSLFFIFFPPSFAPKSQAAQTFISRYRGALHVHAKEHSKSALFRSVSNIQRNTSIALHRTTCLLNTWLLENDVASTKEECEFLCSADFIKLAAGLSMEQEAPPGKGKKKPQPSKRQIDSMKNTWNSICPERYVTNVCTCFRYVGVYICGHVRAFFLLAGTMTRLRCQPRSSIRFWTAFSSTGAPRLPSPLKGTCADVCEGVCKSIPKLLKMRR